MAALDKCKILPLEKILDARGALTFIEENIHIPFDIKRVYYLYDVSTSASRGGHAHKNLQQLIIAVSGSFRVVLDDGDQKKSFTLSRPYEGLYICPMVWREIYDFSSGAVCLVLASENYDETDYYRSYETFLNSIKIEKN